MPRPPRETLTTVGALTLLVCAAAALPPSSGHAQERKDPERRTQIRAAGEPVAPPAPPARPDDLPKAPDAAAPARGAEMPTPPERPADLPGGPAAAPRTAPGAVSAPGDTPPEPPLPPGRPPDLSGAAALALKVAPRDETACLRRLERLGVAFERLAPIAEGQCSAPAPLSVTRIGDGVALEPAATLTCGAAEALARWTTEVQVTAQRELAEPVRAVRLGGSYVCRGQNHDTDAKLSEHAFANAIDVTAFAFAKHAALAIGTPAEGGEERFLAEVRTSACAFFRTVLGPGSNAEHGTHLHLDERERTAGHRLCE